MRFMKNIKARRELSPSLVIVVSFWGRDNRDLFHFAACYWMLCHKLRKEALFEKCFLWPHCHWETAVREIPFSVGSQFRAEQVRGEVVLFLSFSSSPPSTFVQGRGPGKEQEGLLLRGGTVKQIWRTQGNKVLAFLSTDHSGQKGCRTPRGRCSFILSCAPGTPSTLPNMRHQYFIIGLLCSPVHAWVNLEIKLYFHLWRMLFLPVLKGRDCQATGLSSDVSGEQWRQAQKHSCWGWWGGLFVVHLPGAEKLMSSIFSSP